MLVSRSLVITAQAYRSFNTLGNHFLQSAFSSWLLFVYVLSCYMNMSVIPI